MLRYCGIYVFMHLCLIKSNSIPIIRQKKSYYEVDKSFTMLLFFCWLIPINVFENFSLKLFWVVVINLTQRGSVLRLKHSLSGSNRIIFSAQVEPAVAAAAATAAVTTSCGSTRWRWIRTWISSWRKWKRHQQRAAAARQPRRAAPRRWRRRRVRIHRYSQLRIRRQQTNEMCEFSWFALTLVFLIVFYPHPHFPLFPFQLYVQS
jgi:hypothetical protein